MAASISMMASNIEIKDNKGIEIEYTPYMNEIERNDDTLKFYTCKNIKTLSNEYKIIYINSGYKANPEYKILIDKNYLKECNFITIKFNDKEFQLKDKDLVDVASKEKAVKIDMKIDDHSELKDLFEIIIKGN